MTQSTPRPIIADPMHLSPSHLKPLRNTCFCAWIGGGKELKELKELHLLSPIPLDDPARQKIEIEIGESVCVDCQRADWRTGHRSIPWKEEVRDLLLGSTKLVPP